jgi:quinol monooxygenase YgiN
MNVVTLVHHRVADYEAWREVYDSVREVQREGGVRYERVMRLADDPAMVVVVHEFDDRVAAEAFFAQAELKDAMARAGVDLDSFRIEYLEDLGGSEL